jgi:primosomal protein N' (replication factor Y) (superfamily II helicase)
MAKPDPISEAVLRVALPVPLYAQFDYRLPDSIAATQIVVGARVQVPFGSRKLIGIVIEFPVDDYFTDAQLKPIAALLDNEAIWNPADLNWLRWLAQYYHHPSGEVYSAALPALLREGKAMQMPEVPGVRLSANAADIDCKALQRAPKQRTLWQQLQKRSLPIAVAELTADSAALNALIKRGWLERCTIAASATPMPSTHASPFSLNQHQQTAIDTISRDLGGFQPTLLYGVTGSGKTEVYMQIIAQALARHLQILVLLPEITLTPQLEQRFRQRFQARIVTSHSKLTDTQRLHAWLHMRNGSADILLGTRSALFTPLARPGLIILDEEHDNSFKQQEGFRFSARDAAISRAKTLNIPIILGSATPALETLYNARQQRYRLLSLPQRAGNAQAPQVRILDIRNRVLQGGLSETLLNEMRETLHNRQQVLLFLNRRGFAPVLMCHQCGWVARCPACDANMVIHAHEAKLRCHHCGHEQKRPQTCPACQGGELHAIGIGTERTEQTLRELFPQYGIVRMDRDTTQSKGRLQDYLQQIHSGAADIILGTQMLAKGHHFPNVTLVAILDIDSSLFSIDYRSAERLAQMIMQVAGRAGRAEQAGRVLLQTRQPQHPLLNLLLCDGYDAFCTELLQERQQTGLPPFSHQALLRVNAASAIAAQQFLQSAAELLQPYRQHMQILGPAPAPMTRRAGQFRFQLLLQSPQRKQLHFVLDQWLPQLSNLKTGPKLKWSLDIDPADLY